MTGAFRSGTARQDRYLDALYKQAVKRGGQSGSLKRGRAPVAQAPAEI